MTVDDFRQSLTAAKRPAELTLPLLGLWWDAKGIGKEPTNRVSRTKAPRVRGFTPTFIVRKVIRATRPIGMVGRASLFANNR